MTHTNVLNRKLEEVFGVGKEFTTVASLWGKFNALIREQRVSSRQSMFKDTGAEMQTALARDAEAGVPGTGGQNFAASVAR